MTPQRTPYAPYGSAVFRRELRARLSPGLAVGELIDDFHHFRAFVHHDGKRITDIRAETPRYPWTTCPAAGEVLRGLVGAPLSDNVRGPAAHTRARSQCTHLFDAACLAIARAGRDVGDVTYRVAFPDRKDGRSTAAFARNGEPLLEWKLRGFEIEDPAPFAGRSILRGFADWVAETFDPEQAEAIYLFQRACVIAGGREIDIEAVSRADLGAHVPMGVCHSYQPENASQAFRMAGTVRNLSDEADLEAASLSPAKLD